MDQLAAALAQQRALAEEGVEAQPTDLLAAATAFFKWRQAALKANFRRELEGILEEVAQEEEEKAKLQKLLDKTQERLDDTNQALSRVSNDYKVALVHMDQLRTQNDELFKTLEAAEGASRTHAEQARTASIMHQEEVKRRQEETRRSALEIEALREQVSAGISQHTGLLEKLTERDKELAEVTQEGLHHKRNASRLQEEVERLEAICRATGERAAAAEAQAATRGEQIGRLYAELSALRERYHVELSELKAARISASEVERMRERMDSMQSSSDSMVAARDELRASLEGVMAKLAAAEQRLKRQAHAATMRDAVIDAITTIGREITRDSDESYILQVTTKLSAELDLAMANNADMAERLAASDAVIAQQQGHVRRIAEECGGLEQQLREAREHRDEQHRINAELSAELRRMAAEYALGPILILDRDGNLVPQESPERPPPSATAPATSQMEAQSTAVRVILADKAFGLGALSQAIAAHPGSVQSVRAQLADCRSLAEALKADVDEVSQLLTVRPFEGEELARKLPQLQERLANTESCLVASREDLSLKQVHAVNMEARLLAAESALRGGSSLLQGWSGLLAEVAAAEDGRLEPDVRLGLREELKTREDVLHRAVMDLAATAPPLLGGDPGYAAAQVAMREAGNAMMELALTLGDRLVDAPATRSRVLATEQLLMERAGQLARFREVLAKLPGEIADMVERLTAVIPDVQCIGPAVEEMLRCVQHFMAAGKEQVVDVVALQGEVLMLRGLLRTKDLTIKSLEEVGSGLRTGSPTKRALKMVPLEALHASERSRDAVAQEKAALQTRLVDQRVQLVAARHRIVNYMAALREACEKAECFYKWRCVTATFKSERDHAAMLAAQDEQEKVVKECRLQVARLEDELEKALAVHGEEVARLTSAHTTEVAQLTKEHESQTFNMRLEHAEEVKALKEAALKASTTRVDVLRRMMKERTARWRELLAYATLYYWRFRCKRQAEARARWRKWADRLRALDEPDNPTYRELLFGPRMTLARRLRLRRLLADPDLLLPKAMTGADIARMILRAWRGWAYIKRQAHKLDALTAAVPAFIDNIGDRRRLERAWLALRLWTAGSATARAHEAIRDYENATAEANAAKAAAESAVANMADELERQRQATAEAEAAAADAAAAAAAAQEAATQAGQIMAAGGYGTDGGQGYGMGTGMGMGMGGGAYGHGMPPGAAEVGTQYLPNVHTVLSGGGYAPAHVAAADAVAAAQAAGMDVGMHPMNTALQHPGYVQIPRLSDGSMALPIDMQPSSGGYLSSGPSGGGAGSQIAAWSDLSQGGMPPVTGPSQARLDAQARRRSSSAGRRRSSAQGNARVSGTGRSSTAGQQTGGGAVATLAERAGRLAAAVDAIQAGVQDTAALLSPRTKVLQTGPDSASDLGAAMDQSLAPRSTGGGSRPGSPVRRIQGDGTLAIEYMPKVSEGGYSASPPHSPTLAPRPSDERGALAESGDGPSGRMPSMAGYGSAPEGQTGRMSVPGGTGMYGTGGGAGPGAAPFLDFTAVQSGGGASGRPPRSSAGGPRPSTGGTGTGNTNSVQVLLSRLPGRNRPLREDGRSIRRVVSGSDGGPGPTSGRPSGDGTRSTGGGGYGHVSSRLHEETVSTIAKKRLAGRPPERGAANLASMPPAPLATVAGPVGMMLPPNTNTPGPVSLRQMEGVPQAASLRGGMGTASGIALQATAWPHVPASVLPGPGGPGPNTADLVRRRGDPYAAPSAPYVPSIDVPLPPPFPAPIQSQAVVTSQLAQPPYDQALQLPTAAVLPSKGGKVVRFERMTPPPPGAGGGTAALLTGEGSPGSEGLVLVDGEREGTSGGGGPAGHTTYISLPSPVKVSIRLPGPL
ncbi:hypothetical protein HYH03_007905 [Edaphochlamys debaryana]|uniref:Uncharacterized protein n=1 Tax=Edaphochlamys debaryana TaxID=47281 RepID=A0A836C010_9CHLO|nr:hypothetical protein HYH03_007905 [Edaphochlamys debaryana]|eukprot:KAG2493978.1 hypothetical protein HYH03_007905 [Edaphochlamys debaryana]